MTNELRSRLRGLFPAPAVPFDGALQIAEDELGAHLTSMGRIDGVGGVAVNGHAGEVASLSVKERLRVVEIARASMPTDKLVIAGLDALVPADGVAELRAMKELGADAALVLPPFDTMSRRSLSQNATAVVDYFDQLGQAGVPLVVFQYPLMTGCSYPTEILVEVAALEHVVAVKNAVWNAEFYAEQLAALHGSVSVLAACDAPELLTMMMTGADGLLLGASSVGTELWAQFVQAVDCGDYDRAREIFVPKLMPLLDAQFGVNRPRSATFTALTKEALRQLGIFSSSAMRAPEVRPDQVDCDVIAQALHSAGLLSPGEVTQ